MHQKEFGLPVIETALSQARGIITDAALIVGCSRQTIYHYIEKYPHLSEIAGEARKELADLAEKSLWKLVEEGDGPSVRWALRCLRSEIYSERFDARIQAEVAIEATEPLHVKVEHVNADPDRLATILGIMEGAGLVPRAVNGSGARANGHP